MSCLHVTLLIKIIYTTFFWFIPLLFFPAFAARWLGIPVPQPILFAHLLGAAFGALLVAYVNGLRDSRKGRNIQRVVVVGVVSNGVACLLLVLFVGEWRQWGGAGAQVYMWASTAMTFLITAGLIICGLRTQSASRR
jgi:cation transport ATPase